MDKMVHGQNGMTEMVWTKWYGLNQHSINPSSTDNIIFSSIPLPL